MSRDTITVVCPNTGVGTTVFKSIGTCGGFWDLIHLLYWKVEVVAASKEYLAFIWDEPSAIYEKFYTFGTKGHVTFCERQQIPTIMCCSN